LPKNISRSDEERRRAEYTAFRSLSARFVQRRLGLRCIEGGLDRRSIHTGLREHGGHLVDCTERRRLTD